MGLVEALDGVGYVRQVMVDPRHRRVGMGRAIMQEAARRFRARGCASWCLNVKPDNVPAVSLYRSLGMDEAYRSVALRLSWALVRRLPQKGTVGELGAAEAPAVEEELSITPGLLASALARSDKHVRVLRDGDAVVAAASFDPSFPGCHPFAAGSVGGARGLLMGFEPLADASMPHLQIIVEGNPALADALEAAGAERVLSFVHFSGPLPEANR